MVPRANADSSDSLFGLCWSRSINRLKRHSNMAEAVAWRPNGQWLAVHPHQSDLTVFDLPSGQPLPTIRHGVGNPPHAFGFSADGRWLASGGRTEHGTTVSIWETNQWTVATSLPFEHGDVTALDWTRDSRRLAAVTYEGQVKVWDARNWAVTSSIPPDGAITFAPAWNPDGTILATGDRMHAVHFWYTTGHELQRAQVPGEVMAMAWSPTGDRLASVGMEGGRPHLGCEADVTGLVVAD